jgi:hypothetical protein
MEVNMDDFKKYMSSVKAESELKEHTKEYVLKQLQNREAKNTQPEKVINIRRFNFRKFAAIAAALVICLGIGTGTYAYLTPVNYLSVDINPSVELGINTFGKVVTADAINEDGKKILENAKVKNESVKDAVSSLVQEASKKGYVAADGSTVVSVTAESNSQSTAAALQQEGEQGVNDAIKAKNILAVVYANSSDLAMRTEAKDLGISPGKFKLIKIMQSLDPSLKAADYKDAKMTALIIKADELLTAYKNGTPTNDQQIAFKGVKTAAEKVKNSNGKKNQGEETQNQEQDKNQGTKTPEQEKEKDKDKDKGQSDNKGISKSPNASVTPTSAQTSPASTATANPGKGNGSENGRGNKS